MKLHSMTSQEFNLWAPRSQLNYAKDKQRANGLTEAEARQVAESDFNRLLPDGINSQDSFLFTAKDDEGKILGFIWYCRRGSKDNPIAFICDVIIEEKFRGQGWGREIMTLIEAEVRKEGISRIGLHVFGFNEVAIQLYQSLEYLTTDLTMEKTLR